MLLEDSLRTILADAIDAELTAGSSARFQNARTDNHICNLPTVNPCVWLCRNWRYYAQWYAN